MKLTMPMMITAADSEARTISGRIVAFNEAANASTGKVIFAKGSIEPKNVFLNLEHDSTRRIGKTLSMTMDGERAINASFKIIKTTAGSDALEEAMTGLRDGFSIELAVGDYEMLKDGTMKVLAGELTGVALVTEPAVRSARVSDVAASEEKDSATESGASETDTTTTTEGEIVSDNTVTDAPAESTVEATEILASAHKPVAYTSPRSPIVDKKSYLEHFLRASVLNDDDSKIYIKAADNTTSTAPGMIPTPQFTNVINGLANADRGMIDALSRESLVDVGMTFELPKVTGVPSLANVAENAAVTESQLTASFISVPVQSFKGRAITTVELIDRSRPEYIAALLQNLEFAYAKVTDEFATGTIFGAGQQTGVNANTAAGFIAYTSQAAGAAYTSTLGFAKNIVVSPGQWTNIMGYNVDGRPIYNAGQPQNSAGDVRGDSLRGVVSPGLNLYVSRSIGNAGGTTSTGDFSMVVINPDAWTWYESPRFQLRTAIQSDGTVDILYYGYAAIAPKIPFGAVWNQT
jgi:phage head maturation protease